MESILAFLAGLLIGSFLNVCIYRLPRDLSVARPRSFCPSCKQTVAWYDNLPVLSYLLLFGKCRHCGSRIPLRYPVVELLTAFAFGWIVHGHGATAPAIKLCVFAALLIALIFADLEQRILPDELTLGGAAAGVLFASFVPLNGFLIFFLPAGLNAALASMVESIFAALLGAAALWLVAEIYYRIRAREGLGLGDVKLVAMIGAFTGLEGMLLTLLAGSMAGALLGILYIFATRKDPSSYELPFGSFLGAAALLLSLFGGPVFEWYAGLGG